MVWIHVRHVAEHYAEWQRVCDGTASFERDGGRKRYQLSVVAGNNTDVLAMEEFETTQQARDFLNYPQIRGAMQRACASGPRESGGR